MTTDTRPSGDTNVETGEWESDADTRPSVTGFHCSFCDKNQDEVGRLIAGPSDIFLCDRCIRLCVEILDEADAPPSVTVKGAVRTDLFGLSFVDTDGPMPLTDIGLQDGDEVEMTIRGRERSVDGNR